ncbi:MAG: DNA-binding transcriptional regulator [Zetaproteobacteria bacterium]|nr:MAG: DNA-binding transcriptional regulator [Zetaproteobacteria bacterium]
MRRADRLFRIVEYLKARRTVVTAQKLAEILEVSPRTIYRDIADLNASGIPIMGEAGVGYILSKDHKVQPLMFGLEEIDALILGAQMVKSWGDKGLAQAASQAIDKITAVLPESIQKELEQTFLFSMPSRATVKINIDFTSLRRAIRSKNKLDFSYEDENKALTNRRVRPLCLIFFGSVWLLLAWCEKRNDFRNFRIDRIQNLTISGDLFKDEKGKRVQDYCCSMPD